MKQTAIISICVMITFCVVRCAKNGNTPAKNQATCTTCNGLLISHTPDTAGLYYYLPTAFTPTTTGINTVFRLVYNNHLNVDSSTLTIWDMSGNGVFKGTVNQIWNGDDLKGNLCPVGNYPLYLRLMTTSGAIYATCGCVSILGYKGNCIYTGGINYFFGDQVDTLNGFTLATQENLCP